MGFGGIVFHGFGVIRCKIRDCIAAVVGFAVENAVDLVVAAVAGGGGSDGGRDLDARERRPLCDDSALLDLPRFAHLADEHVVVDDEGQHVVRCGLIQHLAAAGSAEAEPGVVGELGVFFRELAVAVALVDSGGIGGHPACAALDQHVGIGHGLERIQCGHRGGFGGPERVVVGQGQQQEALHAPVRAAGGVVALGHVHLRIAVADGQDAVAVEHLLVQPPVEVPHDHALHDRQGQRLQPRPDARGPEAVLRKAVAQAAAKGQGRAVGIEPIHELLGEQLGAAAVEGRTLGVDVGGELRVEQTIILDGPRDVVVFLDGSAVGGPAVAAVIAVDLFQAVLEQLLAVGHVLALEGEVGEDAEELPVAVRDGVLVDLAEPCGKVFLFGVGERLPHLFGCGQDAARDGGHLDEALVIVLALAPVFGAGGVRAGSKALTVDLLELRVRAAAHPEGDQRPERAAEGFQLDGVLVVGHARFAEVQPSASGRIKRLERVEESVHQCGKIGFRLQFHHQYISQSFVRRVSASI